MKMNKKRPRGLLLKMSIDWLNEVLSCLMKGYKLYPEDLEIHRIAPDTATYTFEYNVILLSKDFPEVTEGSYPEKGEILVDTKNKTLKVFHRITSEQMERKQK